MLALDHVNFGEQEFKASTEAKNCSGFEHTMTNGAAPPLRWVVNTNLVADGAQVPPLLIFRRDALQCQFELFEGHLPIPIVIEAVHDTGDGVLADQYIQNEK